MRKSKCTENTDSRSKMPSTIADNTDLINKKSHILFYNEKKKKNKNTNINETKYQIHTYIHTNTYIHTYSDTYRERDRLEPGI